ncbi:hypothetical protein B2G74_09475 [Burkholderia sp. A27]|nr:hypothetical protein B2G74_09475 [Burkholderia sp. A27]
MGLIQYAQSHHARQSVVLPQTSTVKRIEIAVFNGFSLPDAASIVELFQAANALNREAHAGSVQYEATLLSASGGRIASSSSVFVWTESFASHGPTGESRALFVVGGTGADGALRDARLIAWLREASRRGETVHPIAEGRLLLEAAGIDRAGTTGFFDDDVTWSRFAEGLCSNVPHRIRAALCIVEDDLGPAVARRVAESVTRGHTVPEARVSAQIMESARWLEANIGRAVTMDEAARVAMMSERNFLRRFKNEMGRTPSDHLLQARLDMSRRLLVETSLPVEKIARHCGIGGGGRLAKLFRKHLSTTPTQYRALMGQCGTDPHCWPVQNIVR